MAGKQTALFLMMTGLSILLCGCRKTTETQEMITISQADLQEQTDVPINTEDAGQKQDDEVEESPALEEQEMADNTFLIQIGNEVRTAIFADNQSAKALKELLDNGPLEVEMSDYGNFEKVGDIGTTLPRSDEQITTAPGDVILYLGNSITIYYDTNSWNFTRLGRIEGQSTESMKEFLGDGDVMVTFKLP